jgi:hypothetical protein
MPKQNRFSGAIGIVLWAMVWVMLVLGGCGRKAPPTVPDRSALMAVNDLKGSVSNGTVKLTWSHRPANAGAVGYIVLRAQLALAKPECPECPQVFQKVDTVPVSRSQRKQTVEMVYLHDVVDGFRYTFNVRPYQSSGSQGPDSN